MIPRHKTSFCILFFVLLTVSAYAQQANFKADQTSGCSPLAISFINTSTGFSENAEYAWNFGNTNTSIKKDAGTTYLNEGKYTVTLTVTEGTISATKSMEITVYKKPVVDFSVDVTKGCMPLAVTFISHSEPGDGTLASYTWDFGDGIAFSASDSLVHTYQIAKVVSPGLTVTNSFGCYNTITKPQLIEVFPH